MKKVSCILVVVRKTFIFYFFLFFLASVFSQPIHLYLPSTAAFDFFLSTGESKGFIAALTKVSRNLR